MQVSVNEEYVSFQGTGVLAGERQYFVRLQGCSVPCPIRAVCDEPYALPKGGAGRVVSEVIDAAKTAVGEMGWVHITGGEPLDQREETISLVSEARKAGLRTHLQTSGLRPLVDCDFVTVSPKSGEIVATTGNEMILVLDSWVTPEVASSLYEETNFCTYFIQPLWGGDGREVARFVEDLNKRGLSWRLATQGHKVLGIK